jgi:hypothetical protein
VKSPVEPEVASEPKVPASTPKPVAPRAAAAAPKPKPVAAIPPPEPPTIRLHPPVAAPASETPANEVSAYERPSGAAAKHMLNSIKCFDAFAYDYGRGGRQYFSALCKGGNRKQVSCAGAGCKIEYAPAPSHLPEGH